MVWTLDMAILITGFYLLIFLLWHGILDLLMLRYRDRSDPLRDYGLDAPDSINAILGVFSLLFWLIWIGTTILYLVSTISFFQLSLIYTSPDQSISMISLGGLVLLTLAMIIQLWARLVRGVNSAAWGLNNTSVLVTTGPYRWIRHPNYLFYILSLIALFLVTGVWLYLLTLPLTYGYLRLIPHEEALLAHHFGDDYKEYQKSSWKLFPRFF